MINSIKRAIRFQLKRLEFGYRTWKNRRQIQDAYRSAPDIRRIYRRLRGVGIGLAAVAGCAGLCALLWFGGEKIGGKLLALRQNISVPQARLPDTILDDSAIPMPDTLPSATVPVEPVGVEPALTTVNEADSAETGTWHIPPTTEYCIVANKADARMFVFAANGSSWNRVREFPIAMGQNGGPKVRAGDKKTPEGIYFIVGRKEGFELPSIYGPLVFVLDYPNPEDRLAGRTGEGIWIHGTAPDSVPVNTRGCLELNNSDIRNLGKLLRFGIGTPVVIVHEPDLKDPERFATNPRIEERRHEVVGEYVLRQEKFKVLLSDWIHAWAERDISRYEAFYDTGRFSGQGMRWSEWAERKRRIFESGAEIMIRLDSILLVDCSEATAEIAFIQNYKSNALVSVNGKKLSFVKNLDSWKIVRESTFRKEELSL
jgi:murein L,D-transpeptidase YafK